MTYEFSMLRDLVATMPSSNGVKPPHPEPDFAILPVEIERIKSALLNGVFSATTEAAQVRYIQSHQYELAKLGDLINLNDQVDGMVASGIESIQDFMELHFSDLLDLNHLVPLPCFTSTVHQSSELLATLQQKLKDVPNSALETLLGPLFQIANANKGQKLSMLQLISSKILKERLTQLSLYRQTISENQLIECLLEANLQQADFIDLFKGRTIEQLENATETQDKLNQLEALSLRLKQLRVVTLPGNPLIVRDILTGWLDQEIKDIKQEIDEWNLLQLKNDDQLGRLETSLNVKELGLMIRLSFAAAVFVNRDVKSLIKLMSFRVTTVATNERQNISAKSLWNAMYRYTTSTIETVERLLSRMFEQFQLLKRREMEKRGIKVKRVKKEIYVYIPAED